MKRLHRLVLAAGLVLAVLGAAAQERADARTVTRPAGGWTYGGLIDDPQRVEYAYPANLVDRGGQRGRTLIEGRLAQQRKAGTRTPTLVVNGNPLPLYTGDDGRFARPYAFGAGSNGIELRDA